ncbi:MAG: hypothetical protein ABIQ35_14255 [Verrucomicrobiota bacterium]
MTGLPRKTVFIDRNSGGLAFRSIFFSANFKVVLHDDYFTDRQTADHVWVKEIGRLGWLMVTGDSATEKSAFFLEAFRHSKSHVFILCALNHGTPQERADCIKNAYPEMISLSLGHRPPRLWKSLAGGKILPVNFRETLAKMRKYDRAVN